MNRASVILYCVETWTLLKAFHIRSLRRVLRIRWFDHVMNAKVEDCTRLVDIDLRIRQRGLAFIGHVPRMQLVSPPTMHIGPH